MKRTTILLPNDLAYLLDRERRRRGVSAAAIVREAVAAYFNITSEPRQIPFAALGDSGLPDLGENDEYYLEQAWGSDEFYEEVMGHPPPKPLNRSGTVLTDDPAADSSSLTIAPTARGHAVVADESERSA